MRQKFTSYILLLGIINKFVAMLKPFEVCLKYMYTMERRKKGIKMEISSYISDLHGMNGRRDTSHTLGNVELMI